MDGQNTSDDQAEDIVIGKDGSMNANATTEQASTKIMVNDITPPPAPQTGSQSNPESEELKEEDVASVNEAVEAVTNSNSEPTIVVTAPETPAEDVPVEAPAEDTVVEAPPESPEPAPEEVATTQPVENSPETASPEPEPVATENEEKTPSPIIAAAMEQPEKSGEVVMGVAASQIAANAAKPPHRNNKKFAAIVTVVVALLLAGTAVYVYMSANSNTEESSSNTQQSSQQEPTIQEATPATSTDVDQTVTEIEESVNGLNDSTDLSEEDLSDTTLGL